MFDTKYDMIITALHRGSYDPMKKSIIDLVNYGEFQYRHVTSTDSDSSKTWYINHHPSSKFEFLCWTFAFVWNFSSVFLIFFEPLFHLYFLVISTKKMQYYYIEIYIFAWKRSRYIISTLFFCDSVMLSCLDKKLHKLIIIWAWK